MGERWSRPLHDGPGLSLLTLLRGERPTALRACQHAELANARMVSNGRWKLVRYDGREAERAATERWYDLVLPLGERRPALAPVARRSDELVPRRVCGTKAALWNNRHDLR